MTIAALIFIIILRRSDTTTTQSLPCGGTPVPSTWRATPLNSLTAKTGASVGTVRAVVKE